MDRPTIQEQLREIKRAIASGDLAPALAALWTLADPRLDYALQARAAALLEQAQSAPGGAELTQGLAPVRIALAGNATMDHLVPVLRFYLARHGLRAEVHLSLFGSMRQSLLDPASDLYACQPDVVWVFASWRDLPCKAVPGATTAQADAAVADAAGECEALWRAVRTHAPRAAILQNNADAPAERVFGNLEGSAPWGRQTLLRRLNSELARRAADHPGVVVFDLDSAAAHYGRERWHDARFWHHSKHPFDLDATGLVAARGAAVVAALRGRARKCLVLDLDGTLWGGVMAEDGLEGIRLGEGAEGEAFVAFQQYCLDLQRRGIVLAVCSKNDDAVAREPFERHADMRLHLSDFAAFRANWQSKAENLRAIAADLSLGLDALVFVDDHPAERHLVRMALPEVAVPEMPADPADYVATLDRSGWFEAVGFAAEDAARAGLYRDNVQRNELRQSAATVEDFLRSLDMTATVGALDGATVGRIAQLLARTNQFHLTGRRYGEAGLRAWIGDPDRRVFWVRLADRFGDNGLIAAVLLCREKEGAQVGAHAAGDTLRVDNWAMSCRVLTRGVEEFIACEILATARALGCRRIVGEYVASNRNALVSGLYEHLGFRPLAENTAADASSSAATGNAPHPEAVAGTTRWELALDGPPPVWPHVIRRREEREKSEG
jgi:FkbH-like protein